MGLAALLNERDLLTPAEDKSQANGHYNIFKHVNPSRTQDSIVSDSRFNSTASSTCVLNSVTKTHPKMSTMASPTWPKRDGLGLGGLTGYSTGDVPYSNSGEPYSGSLSGADIQDASWLNKIKNAGLSLYGNIGHKPLSSDTPESILASIQLKTPVSEPVSLSESQLSDSSVTIGASADSSLDKTTSSDDAGMVSKLLKSRRFKSKVLGAFASSLQDSGII